MSKNLLVAVSSTTELIRGVERVRVNEAYTKAIIGAGLVPVVIPPMTAEHADRLLDYLGGGDGGGGLLLTGGEDVAPRRYAAVAHPSVEAAHDARDECEIALAIGARERHIPTLAICRGVQVVNVAFGGTLIQDIPSEKPGMLAHDGEFARDARVHEVQVTPGSRLAAALGAACLRTNSSHHQAIDRPGSGICISARAPDGIIEGIESDDPGWWMLGVQWHPEELVGTDEAWDRRLFAAFAARIQNAGVQPDRSD